MTRIAVGCTFCALTLCSTANAQPYQVEVDGTLSFTSIEFDSGGDADGNILGIGGTYYLLPLETVGPWSESAFLQKASFARLEFSRTGGDFNNDTDFDVEGQYVMPTDLIVGALLSSSDVTDIEVFGGTYLDDRSTVLGRISLGDIDELGAEYKSLRTLASGNDLGIEAGIRLIDAADSGLGISGSATYYLTDQHGITGAIDYEDIGDFDRLTVGAATEYFFAETLAGRAGLSFSSTDNSDSTILSLGVVSRF